MRNASWLGTLASVLLMGVILGGSPAHAELRTARPGSPETARPFGLGVILGEPTGLTGKYWIDRMTAVDMGISFSFDNYFLIYSDYLLHFPKTYGLNPYAGGGLEVFIQTKDTGFKDRTYFRSDQGASGMGIRIPLGVEWRPAGPPIGAFAEVVPGVGLIPATFGYIQGGIGVRYYF